MTRFFKYFKYFVSYTNTFGVPCGMYVWAKEEITAIEKCRQKAQFNHEPIDFRKNLTIIRAV